MNDFDMAVLEFMREDGFIATYIKREDQGYDPSIGSNVIIETEIPVEAILMDLTLQSNGLSVKFGTLVEAGDKELFIRPPHKADPSQPVLEINPSIDTVKIRSVEYRIVTMKEINTSADDPILYDLYLRR